MTSTQEGLVQDSRNINVAPIKEEYIIPVSYFFLVFRSINKCKIFQKEDYELPEEIQAKPKRERRGMNKTRRYVFLNFI